MSIVAAETIALRMQQDVTLAGVLDTLNSAADAAQVQVEALLDTGLDLAQQDSVFFLDSRRFNGLTLNQSGRMCLQMPAGFIRTELEYPVTISVGSKWNSFGTNDGYLANASLLQVDYEKGLVFVDTTYQDKFVRVQCTTGFKPAVPLMQDPATGAVTEPVAAEAVPKWIKEALIAYVPLVLATSRSTEDDTPQQYKTSGDRAIMALAKYNRNPGFCYRPL